MKFRSGFLPKVPGRPSSGVCIMPVPERLVIELLRDGMAYSPAVSEGDAVPYGAPLAWANAKGGRVALPAPAAGKVTFEPGDARVASRIALQVTRSDIHPIRPPLAPARTSAESMRQALAEGGIWPLIWSSKTGGMPMLDGSETPSRVLVNFVLTEPFHARGKVVLGEHMRSVIAGLSYLPRLLAEYGIIHLVLTEPNDPVAQRIRRETAGQAWIQTEIIPMRYPVEDPRVMCRALRETDRRIKRDDIVWVLDVQTVQAIGACMNDGIPLSERIVAVGGPGAANPRHVRVRVGTTLDCFMESEDIGETKRVLRGGLFRGKPTDPSAAVGYGDDAFFVLPRPQKREFLSFMNPGFDRASFLPCFASRLTSAADRSLTTSLRGERRPCIACGLCEEVCPMGLLPQVLHRYLHRDAIDEAERVGLSLCVGCGLCSYVCPSKIELRHQFAMAQERLHVEHEEAQAAENARRSHEESFLREKEHGEDWRK